LSGLRLSGLVRKAALAASILLAVTTAAICVSSFASPGYHSRYRSDGSWIEIGLHQGTVSLVTLENRGVLFFQTYVDSFAHARQLACRKYGKFVSVKSNPLFPHNLIQSREFEIPLWTPLIAFVAYPGTVLALFVIRTARWHDRRMWGCCLECGYNLTGLSEPRCPECGTPFDPAKLTSGMWEKPPEGGHEGSAEPRRQDPDTTPMAT
jgi:hypothetical protein